MTDADAGLRILGDWGTSNLRLWLVDGDRVIDTRAGPGIKQLTDTPAQTIAALLAPWRDRAGDCPLVLCGMAGARDGWMEAPYARCPATLPDWHAAALSVQVDGRNVRIAAGLACENGNGAPDVMRGEETQIFGAGRIDPALMAGAAWAVLPGTHSKWVRLNGGAITGFTTAMTGEIFALLRHHSSLIGAAPVTGDEPDGFADGVARIAAVGAGQLLAVAFETRSRQLRQGRSSGWAAGYLSGLLIGAEICAMLPTADRPERVVIIGDGTLGVLYQAALGHWRVGADIIDGKAAALHGLLTLAGHDKSVPDAPQGGHDA